MRKINNRLRELSRDAEIGLAVLVMAAAALAGCSSSDKGGDANAASTPVTPTASTAPPTSAASAAQPRPLVLTVVVPLSRESVPPCASLSTPGPCVWNAADHPNAQPDSFLVTKTDQVIEFKREGGKLYAYSDGERLPDPHVKQGGINDYGFISYTHTGLVTSGGGFPLFVVGAR